MITSHHEIRKWAGACLAGPLLALLCATTVWSQGVPEPGVELFTMSRGDRIYATMQVPSGFRMEIEDSQESTLRRLRYPDGSYIVLRHNAPPGTVLPVAEYTTTKQEDRADRVSRYGVTKGSEKAWREDVFKVRRPTQIAAYIGIPSDKAELFDRALNSIVWR
jgi:hypothetical protein